MTTAGSVSVLSTRSNRIVAVITVPSLRMAVKEMIPGGAALTAS
ncbi:hypothetical protein Caci_6941 [Catenulispora acidiphila DSM 44928]|uniref:Uncharacterized protein n=1 Tax=Catenulispora acidiphila (strain DSM 44928 / JCM 14897 / NBRC 102108 / NRRL B-24433 / ID139908) TaxID=479433 RepID=C7Q3K8_CATAD|nr:hypothetical protein Caci_6941 [Catenulispora acidiphila DSM 44928]